MEKNKLYSGFQIQCIHNIRELDATMYLMEHKKSGAKLCYLDYDDTNMVFSITFNTTPENDTGVFHILEHSVLCGSEKYPLKEPMVELMKGSMQTFLNAMTFQDKTMYPFASQNEKDFMNLMDVYMDAVLHPLIYKKKEIFMQEGWHGVWSEGNQNVTKTGVVYNEMKGASSNPIQSLVWEANKTLFPDTTYRYISGGKPECISDLTYEQFIETHKKYYYPGNSYIFLSGKMNIEEKLMFLDQKYLCNYEKQDRIPLIPIQKHIGNDNKSVLEYPLMQQGSAKDNCYFALNYVIDKAENTELRLAVQILKYMLFDCRTALIRQSLLKLNLAKDIAAMYNDSVKQPVFSILAFNAEDINTHKFLDCIRERLQYIVNNGLDKEFVEAAISNFEFQMKENEYNSYPKGLIYNFEIMKLWPHEWAPEKALQYKDELTAIREKAKNRYFEKLIEELFLNSNHSSFVVLRPSEADKITTYEENKVMKEKEILIKEKEQLIKWQSTQDMADVIKKIPRISLKDISDKIEHIPMEIHSIGSTPLFYHDVKTKGITYLRLYFNMSQLTGDKLKYMLLFTQLVGNVSTKKYNKEQLLNKKWKIFGDLTCSVEIFQNKDGIMPALVISMKALENNLRESLELVEEILYESNYSSLSDIRQTLWTIVTQMEIGLNQQGNVTAERRIKAHYSMKGACQEYMYGIESYKFLKEAAKNFENEAEEIADALDEISKLVLTRKNVTFSYTGSQESYQQFKTFCKGYEKEQHIEFRSTDTYASLINFKKEAFYAPSQVQYVGLGGNFKENGFEYSGRLQVLGKILTLSYLWNELRVKGGAYGGNFYADREGNCIFSSFRDPNLEKTIINYSNAAEFVNCFKATKDEMEKFIIGTIAAADKPKSKEVNSFIADKRYFEGITEQMLQHERKEILSTTVDDIRNFGKLLDEVVKQNQICIVGSKEKIEEKSDIFENIQPLYVE